MAGSAEMGATPAQLVALLGGHPARRLGLDLSTEAGRSRWLLLTCLLSARGSQDRALATWRALAERKLDDPVALAKAMTEFAKDNPAVELRGGVVDGVDVVDADGVKLLSKLPGLPELQAQARGAGPAASAGEGA